MSLFVGRPDNRDIEISDPAYRKTFQNLVF
jgi:hypothetical protein